MRPGAVVAGRDRGRVAVGSQVGRAQGAVGLESVCDNVRMHADTQVSDLPLDSPYVELAVEVFAMLADATRVRIVLALRAGELPVGELATAVGKSPTAVSQHLAKLRLARMVTTRHHGNRVYYALADEHASRLVVDAVLQAEHAVDAHPQHHGRAGS